MSQADFTLTYDGPALRGHEMNVRDLAPAMLAVAELFDAANLLLNGESVEVAVNVRAHEPGSFTVVFDVIQNWKDGALALLSGDAITAALNLKELVVGAAGLIWIIRKLRGRTPDQAEVVRAGIVRLTIDGQTFDVPLELLRLYQEISVRTAMERIIVRPLSSGGIDQLRIGDRKSVVHVVDKDDLPLFEVPTIDDVILVDDTREAAFSILSLAFKEDNKWRLHDGTNTVSALIEDEAFLRRVNNNLIRFAKGDVLVCEVRFTQRQTANGLVTENRVLRVKEHVPAPRQFPLFKDEPPR